MGGTCKEGRVCKDKVSSEDSLKKSLRCPGVPSLGRLEDRSSKKSRFLSFFKASLRDSYPSL